MLIISYFLDVLVDTGKGTLYVSDADGIMYSKSLENHFVSILYCLSVIV